MINYSKDVAVFNTTFIVFTLSADPLRIPEKSGSNIAILTLEFYIL